MACLRLGQAATGDPQTSDTVLSPSVSSSSPLLLVLPSLISVSSISSIWTATTPDMPGDGGEGPVVARPTGLPKPKKETAGRPLATGTALDRREFLCFDFSSPAANKIFWAVTGWADQPIQCIERQARRSEAAPRAEGRGEGRGGGGGGGEQVHPLICDEKGCFPQNQTTQSLP